LTMGADDPYRLPFDQHQRYRLASECLRILVGRGDFSLLEVGGCPSPMRLFIPEAELTVADPAAEDSAHSVRAGGESLPFPDGSFDAVACLDTLEHVSPELRPAFLFELCRVARRHLVLAAPFASEAVRSADRAAFDLVLEQAGYEHPCLKEHLSIEPPSVESTREEIERLGMEVAVLPNGRLDRWMFMMALYYTLDADPDMRAHLPKVMEAYNRALYGHDNAEPAYRHALVCSRDGLADKAEALDALVSAPESPPDWSGFAAAVELARARALADKDRRIEAMARELEAAREQIDSLNDHVNEMSEFVEKTRSLPLYSLYARLIKPFKKS